MRRTSLLLLCVFLVLLLRVETKPAEREPRDHEMDSEKTVEQTKRSCRFSPAVCKRHMPWVKKLQAAKMDFKDLGSLN